MKIARKSSRPFRERIKGVIFLVELDFHHPLRKCFTFAESRHLSVLLPSRERKIGQLFSGEELAVYFLSGKFSICAGVITLSAGTIPFSTSRNDSTSR